MKYLILGASAAGITGGKTLRTLDPESEIKIISEDENIHSRCMLHYYLSGDRDLESLNFLEEDFFEKRNIHWEGGKKAVDLDPEEKLVYFNDGSKENYDKLLITTGSYASIPPIENVADSNNIFVLRDLKDAKNIKNRLNNSKKVTIIGGGLIGIDIATELLKLDLELTIVEFSDRILNMQLDNYSAKIYEEKLKNKGVKILTNCGAEKIIIDDENNLNKVKLSNGKELTTDMVIIAAGVKPNIDFLKDTDIDLDKGIVVDEKCRTNLKDIYAAGDVVANKAGIWSLATMQGNVAASNMVGEEKVAENLFGFKNSMNFFGINTISLGDPKVEHKEGYIVDVLKDGKDYKKIIHKDGTIYYAVFQGNIDYVGPYETIIKEELDISKFEKDIFNIGYSDFFKINDKAEFSYT